MNKEKLRIEYTGKDGVTNIFELTDVDGDRKPELALVARFLGEEWQVGPIESPVAIPDLIEPVRERLLPALNKALNSALIGGVQ